MCCSRCCSISGHRLWSVLIARAKRRAARLIDTLALQCVAGSAGPSRLAHALKRCGRSQTVAISVVTRVFGHFAPAKNRQNPRLERKRELQLSPIRPIAQPHHRCCKHQSCGCKPSIAHCCIARASVAQIALHRQLARCINPLHTSAILRCRDSCSPSCSPRRPRCAPSRAARSRRAARQ